MHSELKVDDPSTVTERLAQTFTEGMDAIKTAIAAPITAVTSPVLKKALGLICEACPKTPQGIIREDGGMFDKSYSPVTPQGIPTTNFRLVKKDPNCEEKTLYVSSGNRGKI
ncbi:MAG: hypothetical protein WC806_01875 [Candidatus Gracilibacteria bacterium]|jgi:hypothetical protein